ncbi:MAG: TIGR03663 family protein [Phycisphaerae bacterium]|nr:TIGR03663 family protein [Phycisphaerae bacterium]
MKSRTILLIVLLILAALALRVTRLDLRPMHTDEAVHAQKFTELLEKGQYRYDPYEYHGPTLNYFTLMVAQLAGANSRTDLTDAVLRLVPAIFGLMLVLLHFVAAEGLGKKAAAIAAVGVAISPAMVYYSRYYIQEMLLVCFTFAMICCAYHAIRSKQLAWAIWTGIFAGLMHATKETCIIAFGAMTLAFAFTLLLQGKTTALKQLRQFKWWHLAVAFIAMAVVSVTFFSSFFTNLPGIADSIRTYTTYLDRAGNNHIHDHPWWFYFHRLIAFKLPNAPGPLWTEAIVVILAAVGFFVAITRKATAEKADSHFLRFIAIYTVIMTAIYSMIPYKTPWCMLGFYHGMILLAGVGVVSLYKLCATKPMRIILIILLTGAASHLLWQTYLGNFKYPAHPANPYVYAHTSPDIFDIVEQVEKIAKVHPDGHNMIIEVICPGCDYWPFPWYLRNFNPDNVAWRSEVTDNVVNAGIIISYDLPELTNDITQRLYTIPPPGQKNLYLQIKKDLRPGVPLKWMTPMTLWEEANTPPLKLPVTSSAYPNKPSASGHAQ